MLLCRGSFIALVGLTGCAASGNTDGNTPSTDRDGSAGGLDGHLADPGMDAPKDSPTSNPVADGASMAADAALGEAATDAGEGGSLDCNRLPLCDDFESDAPGMPPDATRWHVFMGCTPGTPNAPVSGGGLTVGVDSSAHHSGRYSLRVVGGDSCGYYAIHTSAFSKLGPQVYARFYARFSGIAGGGDASAATQGHNGFLSMYSGSPSGTDPNFYTNYSNAKTPGSGQLRLGFQSSVVDWNDIIVPMSGGGADTTLPDLSPMGTRMSISPAANDWNCFEFHIDQTNNHIEFWFNGASVSGLSWDGGSVQGVNDQWASQGPPPLQLQSFGLGWLQLGGQETAWFDDVALADTRIGCQ